MDVSRTEEVTMYYSTDVILPWIMLLSAAVVISTTAILYLQWRRQERAKVQVRNEQRSAQSLEDATIEYAEAKARLNGRSGQPLILEVVNDITFDANAGGAKQRVDIDTAVRALEAIKSAEDDQAIDVILHTLGGWSIAAELIAQALKNHKGPTRAYVPYLAMSAGTMISLSCREVHLGKNAALGPIDVQYWGISGDSLRRLIEEKTPMSAISDDFLVMWFESQKKQKKEFSKACELLNDEHKRKDGQQTCSVIHQLAASGRPHDELIELKVAKEIGINAKEGCPPDVYQLVNARLQMIRRFAERDLVSQEGNVDSDIKLGKGKALSFLSWKNA